MQRGRISLLFGRFMWRDSSSVGACRGSMRWKARRWGRKWGVMLCSEAARFSADVFSPVGEAGT